MKYLYQILENETLDTDDIPVGAPPDEGEEATDAADKGETTLRDKIVTWFREHKTPTEEQVSGLATDLEVSVEELEDEVYKLMADYASIGLHPGTEDQVDPKELEMGIKVEQEHTHDPLIAKQIALDHLAEVKDYYTRLAKMETGSEG